VAEAARSRVGLRGYVTSREFGGARVPVPLQSLALRDYCARKGYTYKLHVNENMFPHSYLVLEGLVQNLESAQGIVMCSMFMLPERGERRARIYRQILDQGAELHIVLEDLAIRRVEDTEMVEEVLSAANRLPLCPTRIPEELVGPDW
jgi:sporadic carbohydrate cluster protein (TIGR04323 family)